MCVAGIPMTCASLVLESYVPDMDATGRPVGLMLTGRHFDELMLLCVTHSFERGLAWEKA